MQIGTEEQAYRFDFDRPLRARGKNGVVWAGTDVHSGRKVIIKWHRNLLPEADLPELPFIQRKTGSITHEGRTFHIYDYFEGSDLQHIFEDPDPNWKKSAFILERWKQCLQILAGLHAAGFLHTDIKPSNWIYNSENGQMYLIDLSSALALPLQHTPQRAYIFSSPEQYLGIKELNGPWSDLFSLGICFYMLFSKRMPYQSGHAAVIEHMQLAQPLQADDHIPAEIWEVLQKTCLKPAFPRPPAQMPKAEVLLKLTENITLRYTDANTLLERLQQITLSSKRSFWNLWRK